MKTLWCVIAVGLLACTPVQSAPLLEGAPSGISPGVIEIDNMAAGRITGWPIEIHNGHAEETTYFIYYRTSDTPREGFERAPAEAVQWVDVPYSQLDVAPETVVEIPVTLSIPADAEGLPDKWEFWIAVRPEQDTNVQVEWASRWLVTMKD
jgi:hypothetical protein